MEIVIRKAKLSDLNEIFNLVLKFSTSFEPALDSFKLSFSNIVKNDNFLLAIAETDNKVIGYSLGLCHDTFYANGKVSWLEELMVDEHFRNLRIGSKLIKEFETWSKNHNCKLTALATRRAAGFYKKNNYEESAVYFRKLL